jgi:hypothetical protein
MPQSIHLPRVRSRAVSTGTLDLYAEDEDVHQLLDTESEGECDPQLEASYLSSWNYFLP